MRTEDGIRGQEDVLEVWDVGWLPDLGRMIAELGLGVECPRWQRWSRGLAAKAVLAGLRPRDRWEV